VSRNYIKIEREQGFLLPPSIKDWVPADDIAWMVLKTVERFSMRKFDEKHRLDRRGHPAYPPRTMVALLVYCYVNGERSSRRIEQLTHRDLACRLICGNRRIDHGTISLFRKRHEESLAGLFEQILAMCREAGMLKVGVMALDGTKGVGNAAMANSLTKEGIGERVRQILREAGATDAEEDARFGTASGNELPAALANPETREAAIDELLAKVRKQKAARATAETTQSAAAPTNVADTSDAGSKSSGDVTSRSTSEERQLAGQLERAGVCLEQIAQVETQRAEQEARKAQERAAKEAAAGGRLRGRKPKGRKSEKEPKANLTDPDSRIMKGAQGFVQGYNAQAVVDQNQIVVAADVVSACNDQHLLHPMIEQAVRNLEAAGVQERPRVVLADAGYNNQVDLRAAPPAGVELLVAPGKSRTTLAAPPAPRGRIPKGLSASDRMERKLRTKRGRRLYRLRGQLVEPVFGQIKEAGRARRFSRRGLAACRSEWRFLCAVHNIKKLHRAIQARGGKPEGRGG
jgi:transposase